MVSGCGGRPSWKVEDIVAGVVVGAEELSLAMLDHAPVAQGCNCGSVDRDRLVGILCFATFLVSRVAFDDDAIVVDSDLAGIEVDGRPLEAATLASADSGG